MVYNFSSMTCLLIGIAWILFGVLAAWYFGKVVQLGGGDAMNQQDLNDIAWRDFIIWAFNNSDFRRAFEEATGTPALIPTKSPIEAMVDKACGVKEDYFRKFGIWATKNHWGLEYAPVKMRAEIEDAE